MKKIFISYAKEDAKSALRLYHDLAKVSIDAWLDSEDLLPGSNWRYAIEQVIQECTHFIALLSQKSVSKKGYVQKELKSALAILDEFPDDDIFIIPVRIEKCKPISHRLRGLHWVDMFGDWKSGFDKIIKAINAKQRSVVFEQPPEVVYDNNKHPNHKKVTEATQRSSSGYSGMPYALRPGVCPQCGSTQCTCRAKHGGGAIEYWKCLKCKSDFVFLRCDYD